MPVTVRPLTSEDIPTCVAINRSLPAWFGLEEGLAEAEEYLRDHHGLIAEVDGEVAGYLTYTQLFPHSTEISWMAVDTSQHRRGTGRVLIRALEEILPNASLLSVKTLADSHPSPEYAITRAFYMSVGFRPQMVFPDLWDPSNPCLLMVKAMSKS